MKRALLLILLALVALPATCLAAEPFKFDTSEENYITLYEGPTPVLRYVRGEILPSGVPEDRRRSTYVHPLYSLDGRPLTDDFPKDHLHHRGLSWTWIRVTCEGVTQDLWTLKGLRQKYSKHLTKIARGKAYLKVDNGWFDDATGRKLIDEAAMFTVYPKSKNERIVDFELKLSAAGKPVAIGVGSTGYSGFTCRFAPRKDTIITTPEGVIAKDENRQKHKWADLSARFTSGEDFDGIAILDNKSNPNSPPGWCLRPYGVLDPAFTSTASDYTIEPGKPLVLKYRSVIHKGKADPQKLEQLYADYNKN